MSSTTPPPLLTAKEVAGYFQVSVRTIRRWRRSGRFPGPLQIGGSLRWRANDLHDWLALMQARIEVATGTTISAPIPPELATTPRGFI